MICSSDPLIAGASKVSAEVRWTPRCACAPSRARTEEADPAGDEQRGREHRRPPIRATRFISGRSSLRRRGSGVRPEGPDPVSAYPFDQLCGVGSDPEAG